MKLEYNGTIYRPPIEANTLLLPVTEGCSHNRCRFCNMYKGVRFRMVDTDMIEAWLKALRNANGLYSDEIERIYLVGADPFALSASRLEFIAELIRRYLPNIEVISMYAAIRNIISKNDEQLKRLKAVGINDVGIRHMALLMLGTAGKGRGIECALASAKLVNGGQN